MKKRNIILSCSSFIIGLLIYFSWAPDKNVEELKVKWAPNPSQFKTIRGISTHLRLEGVSNDRTPIVFIHGTSASLHTWEDLIQEFKNDRRVISFDLPGFGLTQQFSNDNYSIENYVDFLHLILNNLQLQKVILTGNSLGGYIAWAYSLKYPDRVEKLVLIDSAGMPIKRENMPLAWILIEIPGINKLMEKILPRPIIFDSVKKLYGDPTKVTSELVDRYYDITLHSGNRLALQKRLAIAKNEDMVDDIKKISHPTLLIWGSLDPLIPKDVGLIFNQNILHSEFVVLEGVGHMPQEESPIETIRAMKEFLSK